MSKVLMEITMSLDGYTAGPDIFDEAPLGRDGERLHDWMFAGKSAEEVNRRCVDYGPRKVDAESATVLDTSMSPRSKRPPPEEAR